MRLGHPQDSGCAILKFLPRLMGLFGEMSTMWAALQSFLQMLPVSLAWRAGWAQQDTRLSSETERNLNGFLSLLNANCTGGFEDCVNTPVTYFPRDESS